MIVVTYAACLHRAPAPHSGELRAPPGRQQGLRRPVVAPALLNANDASELKNKWTTIGSKNFFFAFRVADVNMTTVPLLNVNDNRIGTKVGKWISRVLYNIKIIRRKKNESNKFISVILSLAITGSLSVVEMDGSKIETVKDKLKECGISVVLRRGPASESVSVVLVGHVLDSDLGDTVNRIDLPATPRSWTSLSMTGIDEPSSAYLKIRATGKAEIQKALSILREVGKEKKLFRHQPRSGGGLK